MKDKRILFTSIDGFIGLNILNNFNVENCFFLTDKIKRVNTKSRVYYYKDFEKIIRLKKINVIFNNRGILLGNVNKLNKVNYLDSKRVFNITNKYKVDYFINLDTNKALISPRLPSSIIGHGKGMDYHFSKQSFREFFINTSSNFSRINIYCDIIYGPNDKLHKFVNKTVFEILNNDKNINLYNPNLIRNFLYIDDFIKYIKKLLNSLDKVGSDYSEYFFLSKEFNSLENFIEIIKELLRSDIYIKVYRGNLYKRTNNVLMREFDNSKNPKWIRLNSTIDLKKGLKKVLKPFLEGDVK